MSTVKILMSGPLTTIQDEGRPAYQQSGMSVSGVMDFYSFRAANLLVGNRETEAVLECTLLGPTLQFTGDSVLAVTGAEAPMKLNGRPAPMWQTLAVKSGDQISFGPAAKGIRLYIAFAGGIDVPVVMESKSTYLKAKVGGLHGRSLKSGDELGLNQAGVDLRKIALKKAEGKIVPKFRSSLILRTVLGPQDDYFTAKGLKTFLTEPYTVSNESDRMGYRLEGTAIEQKNGGDIISDGIVMGAIQVPSNGKPIALMADRQTTGGYTKIATVATADLPLLGQARPGDQVRFQKITVQEAQELRKDFERKMTLFRLCLLPA